MGSLWNSTWFSFQTFFITTLLSARSLDSASKEMAARLADMVLVSEFAEAVQTIDDFLRNV